jgi:ABC-type amino acid transport substrate-binding protein
MGYQFVNYKLIQEKNFISLYYMVFEKKYLKKKKKKINVFIILGTEKNNLTVTRRKNSVGKYFYTGFLWQIWQNIKHSLQHKYDFQVLFSSFNNNNYQDFVEDVYNKKYDMVIGSFSHNSKREKMIDFVEPFVIDATSIIYEKKESIVSDFKTVIISSTGKFIIYLLAFGCIVGFILYYLDDQRYINLKKSIKINKKTHLLRTIVTGISSMFGQTGYLSENVSLDIKNVIFVICILVSSFVLILFLQASITKILINKKTSVFNKNNIKNYQLIGWTGDDNVTKLNRYGANIKLFKNKTADEMIDIYLNNKDKYDGFIIQYCAGYHYTVSNPKLVLSTMFGYEPQSFIISHNKKYLLEDVNIILNEMRFTLKLQTLCQSYFGDIEHVPVCKL